MNTRTYGTLPLGWPLAGSLLFTAFVTAFVCTPPGHSLHSWTQTFSRATLYLVSAGAVHLLAVWGVCRVRDESEDADWREIWFIVYAAWISVVWLPLVALLTAENSVWVALVLPIVAVFSTLLLKWHALHVAVPWHALDETPGLLTLPDTTQLWRSLLPAAGTALALEVGAASLATDHAWTAGLLFGASVVYPLERWLDYKASRTKSMHRYEWARASTGNSLLVWLLLALALVPFMIAFAWLSGWLAPDLHIAIPTAKAPSTISRHAKGYTGIILTQPRKFAQFIPPAATEPGAFGRPGIIPFDGDYWYFKTENAAPTPGTRVIQGSPVKDNVLSTDDDSLLMEARQPFARPVSLACCRTLRVDVVNADNRPGNISLEVLLRSPGSVKQPVSVSLGTIVLPSSTVSPMPLTRQPVNDRVTFRLPVSARIRKFNEIDVRIKPDRSRSLAGSKIAITDLALEQ